MNIVSSLRFGFSVFGFCTAIAFSMGSTGCAVSTLEPATYASTNDKEVASVAIEHASPLSVSPLGEMSYELTSRPRAAVTPVPEMKPLHLAPQCATCRK